MPFEIYMLKTRIIGDFWAYKLKNNSIFKQEVI